MITCSDAIALLNFINLTIESIMNNMLEETAYLIINGRQIVTNQTLGTNIYDTKGLESFPRFAVSTCEN